MATLTRRSGNRKSVVIIERQPLTISAQHGVGTSAGKVVSTKLSITSGKTVTGGSINHSLVIDREEMQRCAIQFAAWLTTFESFTQYMPDRRKPSQQLRALAEILEASGK